MSSGKKKREKALEQKKAEEIPQEVPKVLSKIDVERQKNFFQAQSARERKITMVKDVLLRTNGEFTGEERRLFELYLFEDKSPEETMRELRPNKEPEDQIPPDEFYRLVEQTVKKMRQHIKNFIF